MTTSSDPNLYPNPSHVGQVDFTPTSSQLQCSTSYSLWGDMNDFKDATPLICLHGGPGVPSQYLKPLGLLHQKLQIPVITYDQIGSGKSTHLPEKRGNTEFWTFELFISELNNLITSLGVKKYDVLGHSWGGMIASQFALTQPPGLRKLILASSPARIQTRVEVSKRQRAKIPGNVAEVMERCERDGTTKSEEYGAAHMEYVKHHLCTVDPFPDELVDAMKASAEDDTVSSTIHGGVVVTGPLKDYDVAPRLHEITKETVPGGVLIVNGEYDSAQDEVVRPFFTEIQARVKWIKFAKSSHMPFFEETERFMEEVANFLTNE